MSKLQKYFIFLFFLSQIAAANTALDPICTGADIKIVETPIFPGMANSAHFSYRVKYLQNNSDPNTPTIIVIPGGPGATSIGGDPSNFLKDFNVVYTDPRTLGCNADNPIMPDEAFTSQIIANDIFTAIKALNIRNFYLYGSSYGTVVATILEELAESEGRMAKAVILEGVEGRAGVRPVLDGYNFAFRKLKTRVPSEIKNKLDQIASGSALLLGKSSKQWAHLMLFMLPGGNFPSAGGDVFGNLLTSALKSDATVVEQTTLAKVVDMASKAFYEIDPPPERRLYLNIVCHETWAYIPTEVDIKNGEVVVADDSKNGCDGYNITHYFDPGDFQLSAKIWYLQGSDDPNTPASEAYYHFNAQKNAESVFIEFQGGGHIPTMAAKKCESEIWSQILTQKFNAESLNKICELPVVTSTKNWSSK